MSGVYLNIALADRSYVEFEFQIDTISYDEYNNRSIYRV